ncbi:dinuclear metal center protein, YbgI/SA1388 family [Apibacter mensalis]|uniref:GTP cyclohydrolase 1 type 2 homolog n=1 Tax=Apibacter mensalis TaxID=1586267 RepID=A0A0X3AQV1_9FLAO|nr:Nif3-like dinuclear metal center hexameric protein [Apibacter mensalis]CVK16780.1 dinuclear metal center protein, YbgI/SA1388 family [Apibacter mensalis]
MKVADVTELLKQLAPESNAESFDNVGLLVGDLQTEISSILVTLDCLEEVVDEAIQNKCNMIVTFHPIIFSGMKSITGKNYVEKALIKAIKNDIAIYAIHTNLDIAKEGVNFEICKRLHIKNSRPLIPKTKSIKKLQTFIPLTHFAEVQQALFKAGAGEIGNYKNCSFRVEGTGTFLPTENTNPFIGQINVVEEVQEVMVSVTFEDFKQTAILTALRSSHPYEEIAYEIFTLDNPNQDLGMGRIGELETPVTEEKFLSFLKKKLSTPCIRHTKLRNRLVKKIAVLGGAGSFAIKNALEAGADVFITADIKYHEFFQAESKILIADIGHYESEQFTKNLIHDYLSEKINNTVILISKINTNPINYYYE